MFDLRIFVMDTLRDMVGNEPAYKVRQYALGWYDKAQLTDSDMAEIEGLLTAPVVEPEPEIPTEEIVEPEV